MSGTSLSTAIANENGSTNAVSAQTAGGTLPSPPNAYEKCDATPRLTTAERTPAMHSDAATGWRLSRSGGTEYATPTSSAATTAAISTQRCVRARTSGIAAATATIRQAAGTDSSPAAIGSRGLLTRSISTSVIWLSPTIATLTPVPASSTQP